MTPPPRWRKTKAGKTWWRQIPNPCAVQHVYNSQFTGGVRFTFFAVSLEMPSMHFQTQPLYLETLTRWTRYTDRMTREHIDELEAAGELKVHHPRPRSKVVRYEMVKLPGPLWANLGAGSEFGNPEEISGSAAAITICTDLDHHHDDDAAAIEQRPDVAAFAAWWRRDAPRDRGIRRTVQVAERPLVAELLCPERSLEQLQAIATTLWDLTADGDPRSTRSWIASTDRSVRVLHRTIDYLEHHVTRRTTRVTGAAATWCGQCVDGYVYVDARTVRPCDCRTGGTARVG